MADALNPAWPVAAVLDTGPDQINLAQDVSIAPSIASDWRAVLLLALIVGGILLTLNERKGR